VADPFAGVGTNGVALKSVGARRYLGTERDDKRARLGRGRIAKVKEGTYRQGSSAFSTAARGSTR
jgi:hypothetical protein